MALISCGREKHETRWEQSLVTWGSICLRQARDYPLSSEGVKTTQIVLDLPSDSLILPRTPSPKSLQSPLQSGPGLVSEQTLGAPSVPAGLRSGPAASAGPQAPGAGHCSSSSHRLWVSLQANHHGCLLCPLIFSMCLSSTPVIGAPVICQARCWAVEVGQ